MTEFRCLNNVMNQLRRLGYNPRSFKGLDFEDIWENFQNMMIYPERLDNSEDFKELQCKMHKGECLIYNC